MEGDWSSLSGRQQRRENKLLAGRQEWSRREHNISQIEAVPQQYKIGYEARSKKTLAVLDIHNFGNDD